jgi:hypothetical protein
MIDFAARFGDNLARCRNWPISLKTSWPLSPRCIEPR